MTPDEKERFAKAYRASMDKNPDADIRNNLYLPLTPRELMEQRLSSDAYFKRIDEVLSQHGMSVGQFIELTFGPQSAAPARRRNAPPRHWKI